MEIKGTIKLLMDTERFDSGFYKREFVVTTEGKYPQDIKFAALKEKADTLDDFEPGDDVAVSFDLRGNEYKERFYVNLNAWKLERSGGGAAESPDPGYGDEDAPPGIADRPDDGPEPEEDDIPF